MAMYHTMSISFRFDTDEDLTSVIQSLIQDDFRSEMTLEHPEGDKTYFASYEERGYCQAPEVLSYARLLAEQCPSLGFAMDASAQNEGSGGNYRDHVSARYSHGWLRYEYYNDSEVYRPELVSAPEDGFEEMRLVEADLEQLFTGEELGGSVDGDPIPDLSSDSSSTVIFNYDEEVAFLLPPEYYISKAEYDSGYICLVDNELDNEESFTCEINLLPLVTGPDSFLDRKGAVNYFRLPAPPAAVVCGELTKGKRFDLARKNSGGYEIVLGLGVLVPQSYFMVLECLAFVYEGQSAELAERHIADYKRMLDVCEAIRINGEPLQLCGLTPELLRSVIAPPPEDEIKVIDVTEKLAV